ncbi:hypothetical protein K461DRAFT_289696 [Myriangium duriaei CBS 260.36]|uniref:Ribosome assembly protein 3 n=1 Tax=Myriangium duriaei CBS 260.36 TaxID=1168546 RepID=A0A9P4J8N0_9PEZI|nr:hypothetical protein K461DRAFT_289696 [Myriangium duriaei CBS 260.36]
MIVAPRVGPTFGTSAWLLLVLSSVQSLLAAGLIGLRAYDARKSNRGWRWDLILAIFATIIGFVLQCVCGIVACLNGLGTPQNELSPEQVGLTLLWSWIGVILGLFSLAIGKLAIIAMYIYITREAARKERFFLWLMGSIAVLACVLQSTFILTECTPTSKLWFLDLPGKCPGKELSVKFAYFSGAFSAFTDLVLVVYPISIVMRFQCSRSTKISICAVMAGGLLPFATSVGRTCSVRVFDQVQNQTERYVVLFLWGITEQWLIIILGSLPPLRSYFAKWFNIHDPDTSSTLGLTGNNGAGEAVLDDDKSDWRLSYKEGDCISPTVYQISASSETKGILSDGCVTESKADTEFTQFYLQQVTKEFSDDLDKLRSAPDFKDSSVKMIVQALQQGRSCFDKDDRVRIGKARLDRAEGER